MKKILALFMAVLMTFSIGVFSSSAAEGTSPTTPEPTWGVGTEATFDQIREKVQSDFPTGVILLFGFGEFKPSDYDLQGDGYWIKVVGNAFSGYYALFGSHCEAGNPIQLPTIADAPDGYAGHWTVSGSTHAADTTAGVDYSSGGRYVIPAVAKPGEYIFFNAEETEVEKTPAIVKVMSVFAKIIKYIFKEDSQIYTGFIELLETFGVYVID